jgi:hypothetical protein
MKRSSLFVCLVLILLLVMAVIPAAAAATVERTRVTGVSPSSAPNEGSFTLTITGTGFYNVTTVRLNKCKIKTGGSSEPPFTGSFSVKSATKIVATFDLTGKKVGDYDVSVNAPKDGSDDWGNGDGIFHIYSGTATTATTTSSGTETTTETTDSSSSGSGEGDNSVFFDTSPSGATITLNGDEIGTSPFTYYTNRDGTCDVIAKKDGYEDYSATVTIIRNQRVHFYGPLTLLSTASNTSTTGSSGKPGKTPTQKRVTLKLTPLGTFETPAEESPLGPATVLWAVAAGAVFIAIRRR